MADEGCSYAAEGEEAFGIALVSAVESAAAGEPGRGPFDDPAVTAEPPGGLDALAGDPVADAAFAEPAAQMVIVVAFVGVKLAGTPSARSSPGPDRRDAPHERFQTEAVMHVRARDAERERQSVPVGEQVDFDQGLPRSVGFRCSGSLFTQAPHRVRRARPVELHPNSRPDAWTAQQCDGRSSGLEPPTIAPMRERC